MSDDPAASRDGPAGNRRSMTDSPWYWVYLFTTAAIVGLVLIGPKFAERQVLEERNFQARQRANQQAQGQTPNVPLSTKENRVVTLTPLYLCLAAMLIGSWVVIWWFRFGRFQWRRQVNSP